MIKKSISPKAAAYIQSNYLKYSAERMASKLGISKGQVAYYMEKWGLKSGINKSAPKLKWSKEQDQFLRDNFDKMTNSELAKTLGRKLTLTRYRLHHLGLKRMEMEYWTAEQVQFLLDNYRELGDTEIASIFQAKYHKNKGWSKKHIEKKRRYLKLKRTKQEIAAIHDRNVELGMFAMCPVHAWDARGRAADGEIRYWKTGPTGREVPYIKVNGSFIHWARHRWQQIHGPVKRGYNIIFLDNNPRNRHDSNLGIVSNAELALINSASQKLTDRYVASMMTIGNPDLRKELIKHPELIKLKRTQLLLNRAINEHL